MPSLTIDLRKIRDNASLVAGMLKPCGVKLAGVTKACLGNELIAEAMLAGGAVSLADSHSESITNLRHHFPDVELKLLRSPVEGGLGARADIYFVSSVKQARALVAMSPARPVRLCLLVETGDCREGVPAPDAVEEAEALVGLPDAELAGLATNLACASMSSPLQAALATFARISEQVHWRLKRRADQPLAVISAGGSGLLALLMGLGDKVERVRPLFETLTELRAGEAVLLGRVPSGDVSDLYLPDAHRDAFVLEGTVLEVYGKAGRTQALVDFGLQDTGTAALVPCRPGISPLGASSDYLTVACDPPESIRPAVEVGDCLAFIPSYYALLAAMTSPFVEKKFIGLQDSNRGA